jgi:hypothetical protein
MFRSFARRIVVLSPRAGDNLLHGEQFGQARDCIAMGLPL